MRIPTDEFEHPALLASPVELEFMGLDRFTPVPHPRPDEPTAAPDEEEHCNKSKAPLLLCSGFRPRAQAMCC